MALLEDPTIQRILDEVNKAASGGVFGLAGNYVSEPTETMSHFQSQLSSSESNFYNQDQAPLFYPTSDMFNMNGMPNFDNNINFNSLPSMVPMPASNNFDLYSSGLYNTMPQSFLSPYENYTGMIKSHAKHQILDDNNNTNNPMRSISSVSSSNNDLLLEHHRHQEYSTISPTITSAMPNLGLNVRTTPSQIESVPMNITDPNDIQLTAEQISNEMKNSTIVDKDDDQPLPSINHDHIDLQNSTSSAGQIFYDPNPQVIQRKGSHSVTYKQNIIVRFLQPPPIPNAGPLIIKEIRPPQPPPLPPLVIKQRPTPPKTPPPLIIRERPPPLPSTLATKVITRQLPPEPTPPRAVIIERLPPLPPKPRDIIIERWLPYEIVNQKRKVIVQRAQKGSKEHVQPKNIIITYEPVHAKIVRNFQKQNVTREDPQAYANRYGSQLYDPNVVIQQARAIGVMEDLNPPLSAISIMTSSVATGTDYESPLQPSTTTTTAVEEHQSEQAKVENNERVEENHIRQQKEEGDIVQTLSTSSVHTDENIQEEDVLVEENVTPFYMNSGENLQQTLHRLGIDLPENIINEHNF